MWFEYYSKELEINTPIILKFHSVFTLRLLRIMYDTYIVTALAQVNIQNVTIVQNTFQ